MYLFLPDNLDLTDVVASDSILDVTRLCVIGEIRYINVARCLDYLKQNRYLKNKSFKHYKHKRPFAINKNTLINFKQMYKYSVLYLFKT